MRTAILNRYKDFFLFCFVLFCFLFLFFCFLFCFVLFFLFCFVWFEYGCFECIWPFLEKVEQKSPFGDFFESLFSNLTFCLLEYTHLKSLSV